MPIVTRAGALGPRVPRRDLWVSRDHALSVSGCLVPGVLFAEGAPAESNVDTGSRHRFGNCPLAYDPLEAAARDPSWRSCSPARNSR